MNSQFTPNEIETIKKSVLILAGLCDGAQSQDGAGFNKFDTEFGHSVATRIIGGDFVSDKFARTLLKMVRKYKGQLSNHGITLPDMPAEEIQLTNNTPTVSAEISKSTGTILVTFSAHPTKEQILIIKEIPGRRWRPDLDNKPWELPADQSAALMKAFPGLMIENAPVATTSTTTPASAPAAGKSPKIVLVADRIHIYFNGIPSLGDREKIKALPNYRWEAQVDGKPWSVGRNSAAEIIAAFPNANIDPKVAEIAGNLSDLISMSNKAESDFDVPGLNGELLPFQRAGVEFAEKSNMRVLIADDMGLGKTIQATACLQLHPMDRPAVIIVPSSLKINWRREIKKWLSTKEQIVILTGQKSHRLDITGGTIFIINYDILKYWLDQIKSIQPKIVIVDEAHYTKNSKAQRSKAVYELAAKIEKVILLTGTPVTNRPIELFPLLKMIDPVTWGNFMKFAKRYCDARQDGFGWNFNGASNLDELHNRIKYCTIRRTKDNVLKELPAKRRSTLVIDFDPSDKAEYERYIDEALSTAKTDLAIVKIEKAKQAAVRGKMNAAVDWIKTFIETDGKLVVFCTHQWTVDQLMAEFGQIAVKVTGEVSMSARDAAVEKFQKDPTIKLFVGNIKAAGVGLTLTAASNVAFLEFAWTPGDHTQAEDRCHRIGQHDSVTAWYLVAENTIDEDIVELLNSKREIIETIHDGKPGAVEFSIEGELLKRMDSRRRMEK